MWNSLKAFLLGVGVFLTALANWWEKYQEQKRYEEAQKSHDAINTNTSGEWLRRFKPEASKDETDKTHSGKP